MPNFKPCTIIKSIHELTSYEAATSERPDNSPQHESTRKKRSVAEHTKYWKPGRTLKIAISRYDEDLFQAVKAAASKWLPYVNLTFDFVELSDNDMEYEGDIRVYLAPHYDGTGGSEIGTDALAVPAHRPTMFLGTDYSSPRFELTVIHEFGHALGLLHAHQHPDANIPWDKEKTYELYLQKFGWSRAAVDLNIFPHPHDASRTYAAYDRHSVMHYGITSEYTLGGWKQAENPHISAADIAFIRRIYP